MAVLSVGAHCYKQIWESYKVEVDTDIIIKEYTSLEGTASFRLYQETEYLSKN